MLRRGLGPRHGQKAHSGTYETQSTGGLRWGRRARDNHSSLHRGWESGLYQTRHGAFFKVVQSHHWEEEEVVTPLTDEEAQAFLEKHAKHLVEQYFGSMPEYGAAERRLTIRVPGNLADRMEDAAKSKGLSLNSYAMRCFEQTDDKNSEHGARIGFAAGNFGTPEVLKALPGARMGFSAGNFGTPEEAPADTVMHRPPNLLLNLSSVSSTRTSGTGTPSLTPSKEIVSAFEAMQERIRVLEIALSRMPPPPAGLGHNNPPEPIENIPLSAAEWAETGQLLAILKEQKVVPAHEPIEAKAAASRLKVIGGNVLSFLGRHSEEFSSEFAKKAGATAGVAAPGVVVYVLAHYGEASLKTFATDLIEVHNLVEAWVHLLGF